MVGWGWLVGCVVGWVGWVGWLCVVVEEGGKREEGRERGKRVGWCVGSVCVVCGVVCVWCV